MYVFVRLFYMTSPVNCCDFLPANLLSRAPAGDLWNASSNVHIAATAQRCDNIPLMLFHNMLQISHFVDVNVYIVHVSVVGSMQGTGNMRAQDVKSPAVVRVHCNLYVTWMSAQHETMPFCDTWLVVHPLNGFILLNI